ncbi:BgTH12-06232 [Blumeria graminis f. sp. triticale]|uniref:BgTH12-06232 n=1 Tax=Blumeria graminis f. sp. triticale TaxID=1689686 RepID=A0A9W4D234_BLUGR|nr:BgTH12-06232 [Blumeria graminis f. sp. triticale]
MKFITLASLTAVLSIIFPGLVMSDYTCNGRRIPTSLLQEKVNVVHSSLVADDPNFGRRYPQNKIFNHTFIYIVPGTISR